MYLLLAIKPGHRCILKYLSPFCFFFHLWKPPRAFINYINNHLIAKFKEKTPFFSTTLCNDSDIVIIFLFLGDHAQGQRLYVLVYNNYILHELKKQYTLHLLLIKFLIDLLELICSISYRSVSKVLD